MEPVEHFSALAADNHLGEAMVAAVTSLFVVGAGFAHSSTDKLFLDLRVDILWNNRFVIAFHIVLGHDAIILDSGLIEEVRGVCFLEKSVADVFLVSENFIDGAGMPFRVTCSGENTVYFQTNRNLIHAEAFQIFTVDAFYDFCLIWVDAQVAIGIFCIAEETMVVDLNLSLLVAVESFKFCVNSKN